MFIWVLNMVYVCILLTGGILSYVLILVVFAKYNKIFTNVVDVCLHIKAISTVYNSTTGLVCSMAGSVQLELLSNQTP